MVMILSIILSLVFFILGGIHLSWALGFKYGYENALPSTPDGKKLFRPKTIDCLLMGVVLIAFGLFYTSKISFFNVSLSYWIFNYISWIIPSVFILRAIGEFKYLGFFKRIKETAFAKKDTAFYSPLCFMIGILGLIIHFSN